MKHKAGIRYKVTFIICLSGLVLIISGVSLGYFLGFNLLRNTIGEAYLKIAERISFAISEMLDEKIKDMRVHIDNLLWKDVIIESNLSYKDIKEEDVRRNLMELNRQWLKDSADAPLVKNVLENRGSQRLKEICALRKEVIEILATDRFGKLVAASGKTTDLYTAGQKWWQEAYNKKDGGIIVGGVEFDKSRDVWYFPAAFPIKDKNGDTVGVCRARLKLQAFFLPLARVKIGRTGRVFLVDNKGSVLFKERNEPYSIKISGEINLRELLSGNNKWAIVDDLFGHSSHKRNHFAVFAKVANLSFLESGIIWWIIIGQDTKEAFAPLETLLFHLSIVTGVLILILILIGFISGGVFVKPIKKLQEAAENIAKGELDYPIEIKTGDEIEQLADSFREMISQIKKKEGEILRQKAYAEGIISSMIDSLIVINSDGTIRSVNKATCDLLGYAEEELVGKDTLIFIEEEKEEEEEEEEILNEIVEPAMLISKDFKIIKVNNAAIENLGLEKKDIIGQFCYKVTHNRDSICQLPYDKCPIAEEAEKDKPCAEIHTHFDKKGNKILVNIVAAPVVDKPGNVLYYLYIVSEIKEEDLGGRRDLERIRELTEKLRKYTEKIQQRRIFSESGLKKLIKESSVRNFEMIYKTKADEKIPVSFSGSVMRDRDGELVGVVGVARDIRETLALISDLKKTKAVIEEFSRNLEKKIEERTKDLTKSQEAALNMMEDMQEAKDVVRETAGYLENLFNYASAPIIVWDPEFKITRFNHAFEHFTGYSANEVIGRKLNFLFPEASQDRSLANIENTLKGEYWETVEIPILCKNGEIRLALWNSANVYEGDGVTFKATIAQGVDITERKKIERELVKAKEDAEVANRAKSDFLSNMSHELRTPLNSLIGFSEVLQDQLVGNLNEKQQEYIRNILGSSSHLLNLINDILDLSKVESGKLEFEPVRLLLREMIEGAMAMLKEKAAIHNLNLSLEFTAEADIEIQADERKLKQIMFNLLSNAVKFTPDGGSVWVKARKPDAGHIEISVKDTGIGIKPEDIPKLFQEFTQLGPMLTKEHEGTGLGLALTKKLVELHGGKIWAESEFSKGSTFVFVIPVSLK